MLGLNKAWLSKTAWAWYAMLQHIILGKLAVNYTSSWYIASYIYLTPTIS